MTFIADKIREVINTEKTFCNYHLKHIKCYKEELTDIVDLENWIKGLNIKYQGQHIYCAELDMEFETMGQAARYVLDNGYYTGKSKQPIQTIISIISHHISKGSLTQELNNFHFYRAPGSTKQLGSETPFQKIQIYCPELDLTFESGVKAAEYFVSKGIWTGIKIKTARLRISDVVNGIFPHYRNYTFQKVNMI